MGASRLLVRWTERMSPLLRSSPAEEIAIWLFARGGVALAFFMRTPSVGGGDAPRFDMSGEC
jgi:hypothetical protein